MTLNKGRLMRRKKSAYERKQELHRARRRQLARRIRRAERTLDGIHQELLNDRERQEPVFSGVNRHIMDSTGSALHSLQIARSYL
jgi:hypothetical protein